jgi:hypothetical protein
MAANSAGQAPELTPLMAKHGPETPPGQASETCAQARAASSLFIIQL